MGIAQRCNTSYVRQNEHKANVQIVHASAPIFGFHLWRFLPESELDTTCSAHSPAIRLVRDFNLHLPRHDLRVQVRERLSPPRHLDLREVHLHLARGRLSTNLRDAVRALVREPPPTQRCEPQTQAAGVDHARGAYLDCLRRITHHDKKR